MAFRMAICYYSFTGTMSGSFSYEYSQHHKYLCLECEHIKTLLNTSGFSAM